MEIEAVIVIVIIALFIVYAAIAKSLKKDPKVREVQKPIGEELSSPITLDESQFMSAGGLMPVALEKEEYVDYRTCGKCGKICKEVLMGFNQFNEQVGIAVCYECDCTTESVLEKKS